MTIHQDLHAHINRSRSNQDREVGIEELETAVERIDSAVGFKMMDPVPETDESPDDLLDEARTCIRNDDLTGSRIRLLQVIAAGGPSAPPLATKPLDKMSKAELFAYAKANKLDVAQANSKHGVLTLIQELEAELASGSIND